MKKSELLPPKLAALGIFVLVALVLSVVVLLPWLKNSEESGELAYETEISDKTDPLAPDLGSQGAPPPSEYRRKHDNDWTAEADYEADKGSIRVSLQHRDIPSDAHLKVFANFTPALSQHPVGGSWLIRQLDGSYRASRVRLAPGTWTLGLTGYRLSRFAFRLEHTIVVK